MIEPRIPAVFLSDVAAGAKPIDGGSTSTSNPAGMTTLERLAHTPTFAERTDPAGRSVAADQDFKYVDMRRYLSYLEESIGQGIQFAAFEPNDEALWANVRTAVSDFLLNQWQSGSLLGDRPEQAFFVKCDRSTMTQDDIDNGRLVVLVGVATTRPGEFVMLRITVMTGTAKDALFSVTAPQPPPVHGSRARAAERDGSDRCEIE